MASYHNGGLIAVREDCLGSRGRCGVGGGLAHVGECTGTYRLPASHAHLFDNTF